MLAGGVVSWRSRKQHCVASSTAHAEYIAMYETCTETVWLNNLLLELGQENLVSKPTIVHVDNKSAIAISQNYVLSDKSKHFSVKFHYVRELVAGGDIDFKYVQPA